MKEKALYKKAREPDEKESTLYSKARKGGQRKPKEGTMTPSGKMKKDAKTKGAGDPKPPRGVK